MQNFKIIADSEVLPEDDLNFLENGRQPQFILNGRHPQFVLKMEDDLKTIMQTETFQIKTMVVAPLRVT
jgi:hypothetical protein